MTTSPQKPDLDRLLESMGLMQSMIATAAATEVLAFPLRTVRSYFRTLFRRRVMWVRNWQATPMIVAGQAKWVLSYERRRFLRWIPVEAAVVDTLDECRKLVAHRRQDPVQFPFSGDGSFAWAFNCKVNFNASDDIRSKGPDHGATTAGSAGEADAQAGEETRNGEAVSGTATEDPRTTPDISGSAEEATPPATSSGSSVLEGTRR